MIVLGVDPGLRVTGFGAVRFAEAHPAAAVELVGAGVVRVRESDSFADRLRVLGAELATLIEEFRPALACVEGLFTHYQNPRTAIVMAHARGVILLRLAEAGVGVCELPPAQVKRAIAGSGRAGKAGVGMAVALELGLSEPPQPADVSDALAVAMVGGRRALADRVMAATTTKPDPVRQG
jgi:crossover junction endodeoxyribonuclease RuvC